MTRRRLASLPSVCIVALALCGSASAAAPIVPVTSSFNGGSVTEDAQGELISAPAADEGVYFRATLDPHKVYRVDLNASRPPGGFMLRFREWRSSGYAYVQVHDGGQSFQVEGASSLEFLLYRASSDESDHLRVGSLGVSECSACITDSDLEATIGADVPEVAQDLAAGDKYQAALALMHWAAPLVPFAPPGKQLTYYSAEGAGALAGLLYGSGVTGGDCGNDADFLSKVLNLFGIENYPVIFGDPSWLVHELLIIPVQLPSGHADYRVLDPTFDADWRVAPSDAPVSLLAALQLQRLGNGNRLYGDSASLAHRVVIGAGDTPSATCAAINNASGGCGYAGFFDSSGYRSAFIDHGETPDVAGFVSLLSSTPILSPDGLPSDLSGSLANFRAGQDVVNRSSLPLAPQVTAAPVLQGSPIVGAQLSVGGGSWDRPASLMYQWLRCVADLRSCAPVDGATQPAYRLSGDDVSRRVVVRITPSDQDGDGEPTELASDVISSAGHGLASGAQPNTPPRPAAAHPSPRNGLSCSPRLVARVLLARIRDGLDRRFRVSKRPCANGTDAIRVVLSVRLERQFRQHAWWRTSVVLRGPALWLMAARATRWIRNRATHGSADSAVITATVFRSSSRGSASERIRLWPFHRRQ